MDMLGDVVVWVIAGIGVIGGIGLATWNLKRHSRERADVPLP